jgi:Tol biopolymer transport system component/DNA-binding winged helix-turn-helix (wHTH) protein
VETRESSTQRWRFGIFEVDIRNSELRRGGTLVKLREQSFRILVLLLERAGDIVTREELRQGLWPSDTYVDFDHSLNTAIMKLRDALGDSADKPLYIETIPKRGYRFVAPVSVPLPAENVIASSRLDPVSPFARGTIEAKTPPPPPPPETSSSPRGLHSRVVVIGSFVLGAIVLAAVGTMGWIRARHASSHDFHTASAELSILPVTTAAGNPIFPVFSPDGREIAYVWDGADRRRYDVYALLIGADVPLRLTYSKSGLVGAPSWSPDGREIAFSRCDGQRDGVYAVPALGGPERKLTAVGCLYTLPGPIVWLADGKRMLMIDHCSAEGPFGVVLFSLATGEKRCLTDSTSAGGSDMGYGLSLSPDSSTIAFARTGASLCCNIYTVPLSGGTPRLLTSDSRSGCATQNDLGCGGLMWTPDSKSIVFVSNRSTLPSLWQVSTNSGEVERETAFPAIGKFSKDGRRFVYSEKTSTQPPAIWRADLAAAGGAVVSNKELVSTQYSEMEAQSSPDGSRIVWMSIRTGSEEIWTSSASGENQLQLTHLDRYQGTPRWAPDGKWVVFDSYTPHSAQIFVVDAEGRNLHSITAGPYDNVVPSWSRDGKSIYFASRRTGSWQVWRHTLQGGGEVQVTQHGGFDAFESYDGQTLYFSRFDRAGIWSMPVSGGTELLVVADKPQLGFWGHWAICTSGLYFMDIEAEPRPTIEFYRFATHRVSPVLTLEKQPGRLQPSLSTTADGRSIYYMQFDLQSVIKLMEFAR